MRALVLEEFGAPFVARAVSTPSITPREALVRVRNVGVCGTDINFHQWFVETQHRGGRLLSIIAVTTSTSLSDCCGSPNGSARSVTSTPFANTLFSAHPPGLSVISIRRGPCTPRISNERSSLICARAMERACRGARSASALSGTMPKSGVAGASVPSEASPGSGGSPSA